MDIYYDFEFIEDGRTIDPISIGMVTDDHQQYYAVNLGISPARIYEHPWLRENVLPHLPVRNAHSKHLIAWDETNTCVKPLQTIANEVRDFILETPERALWSWYAAYDHVALCQLWGPMSQLPRGVPMYTNDLKQECVRLGDPRIPFPPELSSHNALDDAKKHQFIGHFLRRYASSSNAVTGRT